MEDWNVVVRDNSTIAVECCLATMVTELADGEKVAGGEGAEEVYLLGRGK